jgi:hypothetical protein
VFNFDPACCDEEDEIEPFSIVRYILIRGGDPDDFDMLKPTAPYVKKFKNRDDQEKFSNPVRVRSNQNITPFENPLASYNIPQDIQKLARNENEAMQVLDSVFRGDASYFDKSAGVDYSSTLTIDNYAECMHKLLWLEEAQMNGSLICFNGVQFIRCMCTLLTLHICLHTNLKSISQTMT